MIDAWWLAAAFTWGMAAGYALCAHIRSDWQPKASPAAAPGEGER
jgi:hypothetical protein